MKELIRTSLIEAEQTLASFLADEKTIESIAQAADYCSTSLRNGHKIISCGNGGSLCDATHFAEELTGRYRNNRRPLPAIAINDPAYMTCTGNDFSFNDVFSRYIEGVGCDGDVLLAISTSGNSANIVRVADIAICAPKAAHSDRIQEIHIKVIHILIQAIESELGLS